MTIGAYGTGALAARTSDTTFRSLKGDLGSLQLALSTGKTATTYAGLASGTLTSLSARATLSSLATATTNVASATLRVKVASQGLARVDKLAAGLVDSLPGSYQQTPIGQTSAATSAEDAFRQVVEILNTEVDGRYLFSGRTADTVPVTPYDLIVNGDATHAGLKQLASERKAADLGTAGLGRLTIAGSGTSVTLGEEAAGLPFGLKIASVAATGAGLTAATAAGPPVTAALSVAAQPTAGDTVSVTLGLPDGTQATLTLTAQDAGAIPISSTDGTAGGFTIGATAADTAANLQAALTSAVGTLASTTLASASVAKASSDFFAGSTSNPPVRVDGPPFDTATATRPGTAADTVVWYQGEDGTDSPRETAPVRTGPGTGVAIGFRANEPSFRTILAGLGALVVDTFATTDPTSQARYAATADRIGKTVDLPALRQGEADLSVANEALGSASARLSAATTQAEDTVAGVENTDPNQVASQFLATQTRLQASYQTTSTIAKLSLVNFL